MSEEANVEKEKFETINRLLDDEYCVVHVDAGAPGLVVPSHLYHNQSVTLKLSRLFRGGIEIFSDRVVANLLFDTSYFECIIPFKAIWGVTSATGHNVVWPQSAPQEILKTLIEATSRPPLEPTAAEPKGQPASGRKPKTAKASHLRRIK